MGAALTRLFLCGDVMTGRGVDQILPRSSPPQIFEPYLTSALEYVELAEEVTGPIPHPVAHPYVWGEGMEVLEAARPDARVINLETSVTTSEHAHPKGVNYRMHPANLPVLTAADIDCCVLANNHVLDWGEAGLLETLEHLEAAGIAVTGAGRDLTSARAPAALPAGPGRRILVFAFGAPDCGIPPAWAARPDRPGVHLLDDLSLRSADAIAALVTSVKRAGDVAVASIHWGPNWGYRVTRAHRRFAHRLIEKASIDIVHGHSSHHPKGIEVYRERLILYGCGDLLNDYEGIPGHEEYRPDLALMYFPTLDAATGRLASLEMAPLQIRHFQLRRPTVEDRARQRLVLDRECARFGHGVVEGGLGFVLQW